jgi:hypothetical protein
VLDWSTVKRENVAAACQLLLKGERLPRAQAKGIFLVFEGNRLPAKHALRLAYCLANELPLDSNITFSSGDGTINKLRALGFSVERQATSAS